MRILIVEDERPAVERLQLLLDNYESPIEIVACLESIEETVRFLESNPHPDLMLLDIHLADGHSFEIFKQISFYRPVIFITAYDSYALEAFRLLSIDYILKPVSAKALYAALNKYHQFSTAFSPLSKPFSVPIPAHLSMKKRFLGKIGQRMYFINVENIAFFEACNKLVHLIDINGRRFVVDYKLEQLTEMLDPSKFFRLNRTFIVHIDAIQQVKPYRNSRLKLMVAGASSEQELIIARERVPDFRRWAG